MTILVNNAARDTRYDVNEVTLELWDEIQTTNLRHVFFACQGVYEGMKAAGGGSIINFSSVSFMRRTGRLPGYAATKAVVIGLSRTLSRDFGPAGIRVNSVAQAGL